MIRNAANMIAATAPPATPAPIPAFAPVERPFSSGAVLEPAADVLAATGCDDVDVGADVCAAGLSPIVAEFVMPVDWDVDDVMPYSDKSTARYSIVIGCAHMVKSDPDTGIMESLPRADTVVVPEKELMQPMNNTLDDP
jgi:hypothetical protein